LGHGGAQRGLADRRRRKLPLALLLHLRVIRVFQKAGRAQRLRQVFGQLPHFQFTGDRHQRRTQVQLRLQSIETLQALHQRWRNHQHRVAEPVGIADKQSRVFRRGGRHEIEVHAQSRQ